MDQVTPEQSVPSVPSLNKDQRYRARHLTEIREKDRLRAAKRRRDAKARRSVKTPAQPPPSVTQAARDCSPPPSVTQATRDRSPLGRSGIITSHTEETADQLLLEVREIVWAWTNEEGPISGWPKLIRRELREAKSKKANREVAQDWRNHALVRMTLLKDLNRFTSSSWPKDEKKLRDLVRQAFELIQTLQGGISIIESFVGIDRS